MTGDASSFEKTVPATNGIRRVVKSIDKDGYGTAYNYVPTYFVYDTDDIILGLRANGDLANRYLHGPAVDEILADENQYGGVLWSLRDQFYNVRDLIDHAGGHYNHIDYDAFGNVNGEMKLASGGHLVHAYGFQSRERDQETGLNYHRNRYYNPAIGRWTSEDPIGFDAGDVNVNRFVGNQPTTKTDPDGLEGREGWYEWRPDYSIAKPGSVLTILSYAVPGDNKTAWYDWVPSKYAGRIVADQETIDDVLRAMRTHVETQKKPITTLNLSGHGGRGIGVQGIFSDVTLTATQAAEMRRYMADDSVIIINACHAGRYTQSRVDKLAKLIGVGVMYCEGEGNGPYSCYIGGSKWRTGRPK